MRSEIYINFNVTVTYEGDVSRCYLTSAGQVFVLVLSDAPDDDDDDDDEEHFVWKVFHLCCVCSDWRRCVCVCVCVCVCGPGVCVLFNMSVLKLQEAAQTCPVS